MTASLTEAQAQALKEIIGLWGQESILLVGASALACFVDFRWRETQDLDLSVMVSLKDHRAGMETLRDWQPDPKLESRWYAPNGVAVDFIPIGDEATSHTEILWPKTGARMSIVGFRLAFDKAEGIDLASGLRIRVAIPAAIAILKIVAYLDRPQEREKDLEDLTHLLMDYPIDDDRRFSSDVVDLQLGYEHVNAYLLGRDIAEMAGTDELKAVSEFMSRVLDDDGTAAIVARMARAGPPSWRDNSDALLRRLEALRLGLRDNPGFKE